MRELQHVKLVTFDCYGTLIDWSSGILACVEPVLARHRASMPPERIIEVFAEMERTVEGGPYKLYREVLREVMAAIGRAAGVMFSPVDLDVLPNSVGDWPVFADTPEALRSISRSFSVGVLSNVDRDLFAGTLPKLGVEPDVLVTAQDVRSYKPAPGHFQRMLELTGLEPGQVLHAAESRFHDIGVAKGLGLRTVWVNRQCGESAGASGRGDAEPDVQVSSVAELAALLTGA